MSQSYIGADNSSVNNNNNNNNVDWDKVTKLQQELEKDQDSTFFYHATSAISAANIYLSGMICY